MKKRKNKHRCKHCRYFACHYDCFPCFEGLKQKQAGKDCSLWEPRLKIQKIWDSMGNMYVRLKGH